MCRSISVEPENLLGHLSACGAKTVLPGRGVRNDLAKEFCVSSFNGKVPNWDILLSASANIAGVLVLRTILHLRSTNSNRNTDITVGEVNDDLLWLRAHSSCVIHACARFSMARDVSFHHHHYPLDIVSFVTQPQLLCHTVQNHSLIELMKNHGETSVKRKGQIFSLEATLQLIARRARTLGRFLVSNLHGVKSREASLPFWRKTFQPSKMLTQNDIILYRVPEVYFSFSSAY